MPLTRPSRFRVAFVNPSQGRLFQAHTRAQNIVFYMSFGSSSEQWWPATRRETGGAHKTLAPFGAQLGGAHAGEQVFQFAHYFAFLSHATR